MHLIGTQKKGKSSPFIIGEEGRGSEKLSVSEKGITAEFWAKRKWSSDVFSYLLAFCEERLSGGKIVMLITTRSNLGYGNWIIKSKKPGVAVGQKHAKVLLDYEILSDVSALVGSIGERVLSHFEQSTQTLKERQAGNDKLWFIARALHFTSTAGLTFLRKMARERPV